MDSQYRWVECDWAGCNVVGPRYKVNWAVLRAKYEELGWKLTPKSPIDACPLHDVPDDVSSLLESVEA